MIPDDVFSAIADIRDGRVRLTAEEQMVFLDAVEELARVLITAPRGGESVQIAIWHRHERTPALAQLADAARPGQASLAQELEAARVEDLHVVRQLRAELAVAW
jgi:hypothetical protein